MPTKVFAFLWTLVSALALVSSKVPLRSAAFCRVNKKIDAAVVVHKDILTLTFRPDSWPAWWGGSAGREPCETNSSTALFSADKRYP